MKSQFLKRVQPRANFLPQGYQVGQRVQPGQLLLNIAPLDDLWVTANFKETQLRHMHIGQEARIHVDAYNRTYSGSVASIGGATGSRYSVLPPENATGNYVRIVQRIPVRIQIERGPSVPT
jgi:membrane fusion protein (multidrug efflux system)